MRRVILIVILALAVLVIVAAATAWFLLNDEDFLKAQLGGFVGDQTGRTLAVDGPLELHLGRRAMIQALGIRFQNADWATNPDMVTVGRLQVEVDLFSLFGELPVIHSVVIEDCSIALLENEDGEANWDVIPEKPAEDSEIPPTEGMLVLLEDLLISNCRLDLDTPHRDRPLVVETDRVALQIAQNGRVEAEGQGRVNGEDTSLSGWLAPVNAFKDGIAAEHDLRYHRGDVVLRSSGRFENASTLEGANISIRFQAPDMAKVLTDFNVRPFSEGEADFRFDLTSEGSMTELKLNGDLGSLEVNANGELDRLIQPQTGRVHLEVTGPDLEALGEALNTPGLVPEPFEMQGEISFDDGIINAKPIVVQTHEDRVELNGVLGRAPTFADSDLIVSIRSNEIGRWRGRIGLPDRIVGPLELDGHLTSESSGMFSVSARLAYTNSTFSVDGTLGQFYGLIEPDLNFVLYSIDANALSETLGIGQFPSEPLRAEGRVAIADTKVQISGAEITLGDHKATIDGLVNPEEPFIGSSASIRLDSPDAAELGALFYEDRLPKAPLAVQGRISRPDQRLRFEDVIVDLGGHKASIDGFFNPEDKHSGSELDVGLDLHDIADLARMLGVEGDVPSQPVKLTMTLKPEGSGLGFQVEDGNLGDIQLDLEGYIPDLEQPMALDAAFDVALPRLDALQFLAPDTELPDLPLKAQGKLHNEEDRTRLENVQIGLGQFTVQVSGDLKSDNRFQLSVQARAPDASLFETWVEEPLPPGAISLSTRLDGNPAEFELSNLDIRHGESNVGGNLKIGLGEPRRVSGELRSDFLDLSWLAVEEEEAEEPPAEVPREWVFDDTPVMQIRDYGVEIDLGLSIKRLDLGNTELRELEIGFRSIGDQLEIDPFTVQGAKGRLSGFINVDGRSAKPRLELKLLGEDLRLGLMVAEGQDLATYPTTNFDIFIEGSGVTRRELASDLDGKLRMNIEEGQIARAGATFLLSDFLTELFTTLNPFAEANEYTKVECAVLAADIVDGLVQVGPVIFNTEQLTILTQGKVDLHTEKLDLAFNSKVRKGIGLSAGMIINPFIKVGGRLVSPAIEIDPAGTVVSGGLAVATAGLSLVAKSMADRFLSSKDPCGDARKEIAKREKG